jgi:Domain of unknown function (DUF4307)
MRCAATARHNGVTMPSPFAPKQLSPEMVERYGLNHKSITARIITYTLAICFAVVLGFVAYQITRPGADVSLISWKVIAPDRTDITFQVKTGSDEPLTCVLRAQDQSRADVGYAKVQVTPVDGELALTYSLRTAIPSYTAEVLGCGDTKVPGPQFPIGVAPPSQPWTP